MNIKDMVAALAALAQASRLELFRLLVKRGPEGYSPGDLTNRLGIPGPTLSFHLKELVNAGLISARKESRFIYYSPNFDRVDELIGFLTDHCCSLSTDQCDAVCKPTSSKPTSSKATKAKKQSIRRRA
jgi:ArsR family transcriptional regulator, arsenate/arsenite/antimonite-responsive transcriptional repressor